jgi:hypothetical protein
MRDRYLRARPLVHAAAFAVVVIVVVIIVIVEATVPLLLLIVLPTNGDCRVTSERSSVVTITIMTH